MGGSAPPAGFDAVHQLEAMGVPVVSRVAAVQGARDKIRSAQLLARAGLPLPATAVVGHGLPDLERLVEPLGPPPWIVKLPEGAQGMGVARVDSLPSLRTVVDMLQSLGQRLLVQHYVREASGLDIRVLVVGGQALAAMRRQSAGDEIRSNLHRGGTAEGLALTPQLTEIAVRAAEALGLDVAGVDMLPSRNGPVVAEVNGSPGLEGLEQATGVDLASEVVAYLERRNAAPGVDG